MSIQKILLFGSFARGNPSKTSDIDLALFLNDDRDWPEIAHEIRQNPKTLRNLDLVLFSEASLPLQQTIIKEGVLLFERH